MNPRRFVASVLVGFLVIGVLVVYLLQTTPPPIVISGNTSFTTIFQQADLTSSTGPQSVLCTATSYFVPSTVTVTLSTTTLTYGNTTTVQTFIPRDSITTENESSTFTSATNATDPVGYVVTNTSTDASGLWTVVTCTYIP